MIRDVTRPRLGRLNPPPPKRCRSPLKLGRELVFLHCCLGHHAVVIEGYLFVVFCIVDIVVQNPNDCFTAVNTQHVIKN